MGEFLYSHRPVKLFNRWIQTVVKKKYRVSTRHVAMLQCKQTEFPPHQPQDLKVDSNGPDE